MRRREVLALATAAMWVASRPSLSQPRPTREIARLGYLGTGLPIQTLVDAFEQGLRDLGWIAADAFAGSQPAELLGVGLDNVRSITEQFTRVFARTGEQGQDLTRKASENAEVIAETGTVLLRGLQDLSRECLKLSQEQLRRNLEAVSQLAGCRSVQDFVAVQSGVVRESMEQMIEGGRRIAERSVEVANEAAESITPRTKASSERARRAA